MKCLWFALATAVIVPMLALPGKVFAGVVMSETSFANGLNSEIGSQHKIVYVQGNKQKVESGSAAAITDLDKNVIYLVDKDQRVYTEIPLQALSSPQPDVTHGEAILTKTGKTRVVADHPCDEYRAVEGNKVEHVTIRACVSSSVPGAKEMAEFDRKMVSRLSGHKFEQSEGKARAGLMLERQSVLSFLLPDPSRSKTYQTASLLTETRVNNIHLKALPPETFQPPKGYSKLQHRQHPAAPPAFAQSAMISLPPGTIPAA